MYPVPLLKVTNKGSVHYIVTDLPKYQNVQTCQNMLSHGLVLEQNTTPVVVVESQTKQRHSEFSAKLLTN